MFRRSASVLGTIALVLTTHAHTAAAHGVEVTAEVDDSVATLELTDETGEVCIGIDPAPESSAVVAVVESSTNEVLIILGEGFGPAQACQFFDVDTVNAVLADVDAHSLVIAFGNNESSGVLTKPRLPDSETATAATEDAEAGDLNVPLIFGAGAVLGIAAVVIRKRRPRNR